MPQFGLSYSLTLEKASQGTVIFDATIAKKPLSENILFRGCFRYRPYLDPY